MCKQHRYKQEEYVPKRQLSGEIFFCTRKIGFYLYLNGLLSTHLTIIGEENAFREVKSRLKSVYTGQVFRK